MSIFGSDYPSEFLERPLHGGDSIFNSSRKGNHYIPEEVAMMGSLSLSAGGLKVGDDLERWW